MRAKADWSGSPDTFYDWLATQPEWCDYTRDELFAEAKGLFKVAKYREAYVEARRKHNSRLRNAERNLKVR